MELLLLQTYFCCSRRREYARLAFTAYRLRLSKYRLPCMKASNCPFLHPSSRATTSSCLSSCNRLMSSSRSVSTNLTTQNSQIRAGYCRRQVHVRVTGLYKSQCVVCTEPGWHQYREKYEQPSVWLGLGRSLLFVRTFFINHSECQFQHWPHRSSASY